MSLTIANTDIEAGRASQANFLSYLEIDLDDSYPQATGGYDLAAAIDAIGIMPDHGVLHVQIQQTATYTFRWNQSTKKFTVHATADGAEAANGADLQAVVGLQAAIFSQ